MNINNKFSLSERLTTQQQVANFLNPNLYLSKKLEKQRALPIDFQTIVPQAPEPLKTLTSHQFCYLTFAACLAFFVHYQLMCRSYEKCSSEQCDVTIDQLKSGYVKMMVCAFMGMFGCIGNFSRPLTPYSYDDELISSNCLVKSQNKAKAHQDYVFSSKPFRPAALDSLPGVLLFSESSFSLTKEMVAPGVCNGMSWWYIILYLYSMKNQPQLENRAETIAHCFKDGAPKPSLFIQALHNDFFFSTPTDWKLFCDPRSKLDSMEAQKAESNIYLRDYTFINKVFNVNYNNHFIFDVSQESSIPDLEKTPQGIYKIVLHNHAMVLIKEDSRTLLFDPNYGLYELDQKQLAYSFNQFCKLYMEKGKHTYGVLHGIQLNPFYFGSNNLFAKTYLSQCQPELKNPFSRP